MFGNGTKLEFKRAAWAVAAVCFIMISSPAFARTEPKIADKCRADLAKRLSVKVSDVTVSACENVNWPDASLGLPEPGKMYAQVVTPGWRIVLEAKAVHYLYHAGERVFKYAGPASQFSWNVYYLVPVKNEPNLNCDLYQTSFNGGKPRLIQKGVNDFFPQADGTIIAKRRTSRSGHELLFIDPSTHQPGTVIEKGFDFGAAVVYKDKWAVTMRPTLAFNWVIAYGDVHGNRQEEKRMDVPVTQFPASIFWDNGYLLAAFRKDKSFLVYRACDEEYKPIWKESRLVNTLDDPMLLNKSESLAVYNESKDGKPVVRVASAWFTGTEDTVALIEGFVYEHALLAPDLGTVVLTGKRNEAPAACIVNMQSRAATWCQPANAEMIKVAIVTGKL